MLERGIVCRSFHLLIKGLCNNYLEGRMCGKWVKYAPKLSHTPPPLIKQKLISIPPHIMMILRLTPPPLPPFEKGLLPLIPSYLVYLLDFFLQYKHHFKWLLDIHRRVIWIVIRITELYLIVSSLHELRDSSSSTTSLALKIPVCVGENSINQLSFASTYLKTFLL